MTPTKLSTSRPTLKAGSEKARSSVGEALFSREFATLSQLIVGQAFLTATHPRQATRLPYNWRPITTLPKRSGKFIRQVDSGMVADSAHSA